MTILGFTAPWCGPCKLVKQQLQEAGLDKHVTWVNIDDPKNEALRLEHRVMSVPALVNTETGERASAATARRMVEAWSEGT